MYPRLSSKEIYFDDGTTLSLPTESSWAAVTDTDFQGEMKLICDTMEMAVRRVEF